ncbi:hypothetical protein M5K25_009844 [Dendrobium thyrsiflorum]|uniref:Growth-regulating factor n=1 Tax=Dendrobium thyrsiflorum TaxID=117978 RepID=A0ABD0V6S3_DENTH
MSSMAAAGSGGKGWMQMPSTAVAAEMGWRQPFTAAQWRELEHQALIFKYLVAGVPVPPDLLIPIQRSLEALPSRFYHHYPAHSSPVGYFSYYGKKLDPEPGRCRRTDGKKWRCSKDAHPDSKYCERHMHRSRNRSRKHVESKSNISPQQSQSNLSSSSTSTSHVALGSSGSFQNISMQSAMTGASKTQGLCSGTSASSHLQSDSQHYGKEYRYLHGAKIDLDKHNFFSEYPGSLQTDLSVNSSPDNSWGLMPSQVPSFSISKGKTSNPYGHYSSQLHAMQNLNEVTMRSIPKQQEQLHSYFKSNFGLPDPGKQECQGLGTAFNEWPKARESWLDLKDEHSERNSFSATQLSISIPMASSDFSTTTCCSPNDD